MLAARLKSFGIARAAHARAGRLARRRDHALHPAVGRGAAARAERRGGAVCGRARRSSQHADPAGARARQMGGVRPLRQFHPHLPGRGRQGRSARDPRAWSASSSATPSPISPSSSTFRPRRACAAPRRAAARRGADRFEAETLAFHEKLRDGFLTLAANEPNRCVLIDATMPKERGRRADLARRRQEARSRHRADPVRGRGLLTILLQLRAAVAGGPHRPKARHQLSRRPHANENSKHRKCRRP